MEDFIISVEECELLLDECIGICLNCREEVEEIEPDGRHYDCPHCGENQVFGAEALAEMGFVKE